MGYFSDAESASLQINAMILHVVGDDLFEPADEREIEHAEFFLARIRDTDLAAVYSFNELSETKLQIERIATRQDAFEVGSQNLSREFSRLHGGSSRDGAFFIFELSVADPGTRLYSLIKYDYREALEQTEGLEGGLLRRIVHAFIADRKAIQKSAIVRISNGVADATVSARDRVKQAPEISDYFATFLDVRQTRSNAELNATTVKLLIDVLSSVINDLPDQNLPHAIGRAKAALSDRQQITEQAVSDAILAAAGNPQDEPTRVELQNRTRRKMRSFKLEGLAFPPDHNVLARPNMRRLKTTEGVTLIYPDQLDNAVVHRDKHADGSEIITVTTQRITEDKFVNDRARNIN